MGLAAAEQHLTAMLADQMLHGALSFDDATQIARRQAARPGWLPAAPPAGRRRRGPDADLELLCQLVISQPDALHQMSTFIGGRILEPDGARVLACVLHLAGREDSARFWWQYAAGADDTASCYCLFLHHTALGETWEANWWHDQADPDRKRALWPARADRYAMAIGWTTCLEVVVEARHALKAADAVVGYVRTAVEFVDDDVDLPLPAPEFAERIEEITADV